MNLCPCHSGKSYEDCCKPYHDRLPAPTPLFLMRSRYSAYVLAKIEYIIDTTHPRSPYYESDRKKWASGIFDFSKNTQFIDLKILGSGDNWVHFSAKLKQKEEFIMEEKSLFQKVDGKWYYVKGEVK